MNENRTELQKSNGGAMTGPESTHAGPVFTPAVDIFETDHSITVLADMPGVEPADLTIDLRESVLTLVGRVKNSESPKESPILSEYTPGTFLRQFTLSEAIDQGKIDAKLSEGVLRVELPKVEKAKPRTITVHSN